MAKVQKIVFSTNPSDGDTIGIRMLINGNITPGKSQRFVTTNIPANAINVVIQPTLAATLQHFMNQYVSNFGVLCFYQSPNTLFFYYTDQNANTDASPGGFTGNSANVFFNDDFSFLPTQPPISFPLIVSPYTDVAWTLDNKDFEIVGSQLNTYVEITCLVNYVKDINVGATQITLKDKIALRNQKGYINYGRRLHQIMTDFDTIIANSTIYNTATVSFTAVEKDLTTNLPLTQYASTVDIVFFAGRSINNTPNCTFLLSNVHMERVTPNTVIYLLHFFQIGTFKVITYVNNIFVDDFIYAGNNNIILSSSGFTANHGDVLSFEIIDENNPNIKSIKKEFILFTEGRYSNVVHWVNEFKNLSNFDFTGAYELKSDFEYIIFNSYKDFVEHLQIIDTKKVYKLTLNTGWMLKTDQITIDSLLMSKSVWLRPTNGELIELKPISKSLPNFNSENETIAVNVEFQINRKSNEETYSF